MKTILFILSLGLLASCAKSNMAGINPNNDSLNEIKSLDFSSDSLLVLDTIAKIDTVQFVEEILVNELQRAPMDRQPDRLRIEDEIRLIERHENKTGLKVIDRTAGNTMLPGNSGWIAYSVPEEMKVQKNYTVKVRISKKQGQSKAELILGNHDPINNPEFPTIAVIEDVKVSGEMSAELRGDDTQFKIVSLSTPVQNIDDESYTEWDWIVTPLKSGSSSLKLVVKVKDLNKDIVVFNKNIKIKSNVPVVVEGFFEKYWQWFMTTIIIPVFIYFWNRKKKRRQTKKS